MLQGVGAVKDHHLLEFRFVKGPVQTAPVRTCHVGILSFE